VVLALRGRLLDVLGRREEAEAALAAAVALRPKDPEPHRVYAELLMGWDRLEEAGWELRLAKELGPPSQRLELALTRYEELLRTTQA
jgi:Flp pilus assembly protein TadD